MKHLDAVARKLQRIERCRVASLHRRINFRRRDPQSACLHVQPVELLRRRDQRRIAMLRHVIDNGARRCVDVGGDFALHGEERIEAFGEIGGLAIEADRHSRVRAG